MKKIFADLRKELKKDYGITKKSVSFIPFENWRGKLKNYPTDFKKEFNNNFSYLKNKLDL